MNRPDGKAPYDKLLRPVRKPGQLGDWATLIVLALAASLWFIWPTEPPRRNTRWQIPEPSCSYGVLSPSSSAGDVLGRFAAPLGMTGNPSPFARLPSIDVPPVPEPTAPRLSPIPPPSDPGGAIPEAAFLIPMPHFPYRTSMIVSTDVVVQVSAPLRNANFTFETPTSVSDASPFSLQATLAFGPAGDVESLLVDAFSGPASLLVPWRTALQFAHAASNAVGTVKISRTVASPHAFSLQ